MAISDTVPFPAWVETGARQIQGLDLLGLRLSAQAISAKLLDGITTITPTVRYVSIQAWLAHSYAQAKNPDGWAEFRDFAAAAESAIAFGNVLVARETTGVVGSDTARKLTDGSRKRFTLEALVSQLAISSYANVCAQLGVTFARDSGVPGLTVERGLPLAEALARRVGKTAIGTAISRGESLKAASRGDLEEFGEVIAVDNVPAAERDLLVRAIVPAVPRQDERGRIATYAALLAFSKDLGRQVEEADLFEEARSPKRRRADLLDPILDGWLRFSVRDLLVACHESVLLQIVEELQRQGGQEERSVLASDVLGGVMGHQRPMENVLRDVGLLKKGERLRDLDLDGLGGRISAKGKQRIVASGLTRWEGGLNEWDLSRMALSEGAGALALLPVAWLLAEQRAAGWEPDLRGAFEDNSGLGWARLGLHDVIVPELTRYRSARMNLLDVIQSLALRTVAQHLRITWSRLAQDPTKDASALFEDGDYWIPRNKELKPGRTASRLRQAVGWLAQLELVGEDGLTTQGEKILQSCLGVLGTNGGAE